ncbi:MAG: ABC transporter permease [Rikenellaceae bacterium]
MMLLWKLLRKNINLSQIVGFAIANLVGMVVLMLGVQLYFDIRTISNQNDSFMKSDYLIIAKRVSLIGSALGQKGGFSIDEIEQIKSKPFVESVGKFSSSDFRVYASIAMAGNGISSDIFFESVPDAYLDTKLDSWHFNPDINTIPIIIPSNYLNLYNFGFSQSRNLPRLTQDAISMVNFDVNISGGGSSDNFKGRIVGFSNRLNTILVPDAFMQWANNKYSKNSTREATRLIVEVQNSADKRLLYFIKERGYEIEGDALADGEMAYFARLITMIVLVVGFIVTFLSIYILILSVFLLLEKNSSKIENLLLMGYSSWSVIIPYSVFVALVNLLIMIVSVSLVVYLRGFYVEALSGVYSLTSEASASIYLVGGVLFFVITIINSAIIKNKISKI